MLPACIQPVFRQFSSFLCQRNTNAFFFVLIHSHKKLFAFFFLQNHLSLLMAFGMLIFGVVPSINSDGAVVQYKIDGWAASEANLFFFRSSTKFNLTIYLCGSRANIPLKFTASLPCVLNLKYNFCHRIEHSLNEMRYIDRSSIGNATTTCLGRPVL